MFVVIFRTHSNQSCSSVPIACVCESFGHNVCRLLAGATVLDVHLVTCAEYVAKPSEIYSVRSRDMARCWVLPDLRIFIVAWLSSSMVATTFRSNTMSRNWSAGNPSRRTAALAATISASGVLCDMHVCFLDTPFNGKKMLGPGRAIQIPVVDFDDSSPAKSASL